MIPLRDHAKRYSFPFINYAIILGNIAVYWVSTGVPDFGTFVSRWAFIPSLFRPDDLSTLLTVYTSAWLHGGLFHLLSNMWFLHLFGDNVEDRLGHLAYLSFYLSCGFASVMAQYIIAPTLNVPMIGASGAISGVTGAYALLHGKSKVETLIPLGGIVLLPAGIFFGYWFILQLIQGYGSLALADTVGGGVAFFAHIGGFLAGLVLAMLLPKKRYNELV